MLEHKAAIRQQGLARRDALDVDRRAQAGALLGERLLAELAGRRFAVAAGYLPIRSEVDIRPVMLALRQAGARICVPAIIDGDLQFRELAGDAALEAQGFGTLAPGAAVPVLEPELMLVPLAAFDARCGRIGYGKGFYDRAIARLSRDGWPLAVGIAFAAQEVDQVPMEAHDRFLDMVVTETATHRPSTAPYR